MMAKRNQKGIQGLELRGKIGIFVEMVEDENLLGKIVHSIYFAGWQ